MEYWHQVKNFWYETIQGLNEKTKEFSWTPISLFYYLALLCIPIQPSPSKYVTDSIQYLFSHFTKFSEYIAASVQLQFCDFYPSFFLDNLKILKKTNIRKIVSLDNSFFLTNFWRDPEEEVFDSEGLKCRMTHLPYFRLKTSYTILMASTISTIFSTW